jgi:HSP20 family protein
MFRQVYNPWYDWNNQWREMEQLRREMNQLFEVTAQPTAAGFPAMNVWTSDDAALVTAEIAGVTPDNLNIEVSGNTLTVTGSREAEKLPEGGKYHRRERNISQFSRTFQFPFTINAEGIEASCEKGVLRLALPRAKAEKPHKITVKS